MNRVSLSRTIGLTALLGLSFFHVALADDMWDKGGRDLPIL